MRFNKLFSTTFLLGLAELAHCLSGGYGDMTFYGTHGNRPSDEHHPSCGGNSKYQTDFYVAINKVDYDRTKTEKDNSYSATVCDQCIKVMRDGKYAIGRVVDRCGGDSCVSGNIDVSPEMFKVFDRLGAGRIKVTWELLDSCSRLEEYGSCSDSGCSSGGSSSNKTKKTTRKTTTKKITTKSRTTQEPSKPTTKERPTENKKTVVITTKKVIRTTKQAPVIVTSKTIINNGNGNTKTISSNPSLGPISPSNNNSAKSLPGSGVAVPTPFNNNNNNGSINNNNNNDSINNNNSNGSNNANGNVNEITDENIEEDGGSSTAYIVIPAAAVAGAAGLGLLYAKRNPKNYEAMKRKFPEAFTHLKRSITRGSSNIRRGITRSGNALKRSLSLGTAAAGSNPGYANNYQSVTFNTNANGISQSQPVYKVVDHPASSSIDIHQ